MLEFAQLRLYARKPAREAAEGKPVEIGRLQRYATDVSMRSKNTHIQEQKLLEKALQLLALVLLA